DLLARGAADRGHTRPHRLAVEVERAGAAQRHAAAELGTGETERFPDNPEQRGVWIDIDGVISAVDSQLDSHRNLLKSAADLLRCTAPTGAESLQPIPTRRQTRSVTPATASNAREQESVVPW